MLELWKWLSDRKSDVVRRAAVRLTALLILGASVTFAQAPVEDEATAAPAQGHAEPVAESEVVVYAALDREFSEPILKQFEQETGIRVLANYDVESTKTVGLTTRLLQEASHPRCDVFWNNEVLHTVRLAREGVLDEYVSPRREDFPKTFHSPTDQWQSLAARARVIIVNTNRIPNDAPDSIYDLIDPKWKGQVGLAKPLFGTTATQAAVLYDTWGQSDAASFYSAVRDNCKILSGNKQVALAVASGELAWGFTDTDDAIIELDAGRPVAIVFPDQGDDELGSLYIPNTLGVINNCPHPVAARRLVDYLLSPEVERQLAQGRSAQFPLGATAAKSTKSRAQQSDRELKWMDVNFAGAASQWDAASAQLRDLFATVNAATLHPVGLVMTIFGAVLFFSGLLRLAPSLIRADRNVNRVLYATVGLLLAATGWWVAVHL